MAVSGIDSPFAGPAEPGCGCHKPACPAAPAGGGPFARALDQFLGRAVAAQQRADQAVCDLALGKTDEIHSVMLAVARADLNTRLVMQVQNRLVQAYQDISRTQV